MIFPNGAVTLVLILAESHLAIHTWPEENLVAVDLFTCGAIDADRVVAELITACGCTTPACSRSAGALAAAECPGGRCPGSLSGAMTV